MIVISPETRMMGLPCGEEIMIVGQTVWTQSTSVTDRRTDGQNYAERRTVKIGQYLTNLCVDYAGLLFWPTQ